MTGINKKSALMVSAQQFAAKCSFTVTALNTTKVGVLWLFMV
ncbi:hypothetical protein ykris0001_29570 [Yersinia kristensenii ATCC 33638]|nr:hypothetical protein ykris0001_29570 [Yersinia kristensenii ATCC 33638]